MSLYDPATPPPAPLKEKLSKSALKKAAKPQKEKKDKSAMKAQWAQPNKEKEKKKNDTKPAFVFTNTTPKGSKKEMAGEMLAEYQPQAVEAAWQDWWEASGFYKCDAAEATGKDPKKDRFTMVIPPPNVTGSLHLGHALTAAVEDTLTRWHRMCGHATLYVPGTDHAGIATQSVVEKQLVKSGEVTSRHELGRDKFLEKVWEWKVSDKQRIYKQTKFWASVYLWRNAHIQAR